MKKIVGLCGLALFSVTHAQETKMIYRTAFDIKYLFFSIKTNGVVGVGNQTS